jgi:DNA transposition AAA+ family ATPase
MRVLKGCGVEMLIIDEADRFKPKTFAEVRDIFDKLEIRRDFGGNRSLRCGN